MKIQLTGNELTNITKALVAQGMFEVSIDAIDEMIKCGVLDGVMDASTHDVTVIIDESYTIETSKGFIELMRLISDTVEQIEQIASDMEERTTDIVGDLMKRKATSPSNNTVERLNLDDFISYMNKKLNENIVRSEGWGEIPNHEYNKPTNNEISNGKLRMWGGDYDADK